jgi:predicted AlkP superfamily pyrophosphatase or phosphodiesterase
MRVVTAWLIAAALILSACQGVSPGPASGPPIVVLVAFDGWRWDYLDRVDAPVLERLARRGVRSEGLIPVFPALTFPNHYTLVTGLRPARHGIISNTMLDQAIPGRFTLSDTRVTGNPAWWSGEPIWHTATRQGQKSATMFWPGSDVAIGGKYPTYWRQFEHTLPPGERTDQVLKWLRLPEVERPRLITVYYSDLDSAGHDEGPDSQAVRDAAARVDHELGRLVEGVEALRLQSRVHWIVVSDHGMAPLSADRLIVLDDYVDLATVETVDMGPWLTVNPVGVSADTIYAALHGKHPRLRVFRSSELPAQYGLAGHPRVPAIVGLADEGWYVVTRERLANRDVSRPWGGAHGFDPAFPSMRGLFVAAGPRLEEGLTIPPVENTHVYELMCALLGLTPAPNDGDPHVSRPWMREAGSSEK